MEEREINLIVVHCSDSAWGSAEVIDRWHREFGWSGIGYNYVLTNGCKVNRNDYDPKYDGITEIGRPVSDVPAHVRGHNDQSIGICVIGVRHFTKTQFVQLNKLLMILMGDHDVPLDRVVGHYELDQGKTCPNFDMDMVRDELGNLMVLAQMLTPQPN